MNPNRNVPCVRCNTILLVATSAQTVQVQCPKCGIFLQIPGDSNYTAPDDLDFEAMQTNYPAAPFPTQQIDRYRHTTAAPPQYGPTAPPRHSHSRLAPRRGIPNWIYLVLALVIVPPVLCGVSGVALYFWASNRGSSTPISESGLQNVPIPDAFPSLGAVEQTFASGVTTHFVRVLGDPTVAGSRMTMRVYIPAGTHVNQSLPCVLVAPVGTPLIHGVDVDPSGSYHDETLPYAEAGMVVIHYSIDGAMPASAENSDQIYLKSLPLAYQKFRNAGAGIVNGRNAVEYAIKKIAIVNPQKIYCAGHSSAGSLALLLAATEPRIRRCAAFAAAYDLESRMQEITSDVTYRMMLPGIKDFVSESSPLNHVDEFRCPLLIFHALDDSNVPLEHAEHFRQRLQRAGKDATHLRVTGDHYTPMIETGIPAAIDFFKR